MADRDFKWYVLHTQTGFEQKIEGSLNSRAEVAGCRDCFSKVIVPTERVSEVKDGKKKITERKFYPGYILIEMALSDESWYVVHNTPGITGFVGSGKTPLPLKQSDVDTILRQQEEKMTRPKPKVDFREGETVRVKEGSFENFNGTIEEVNPNRGKIKVTVTIFGRATPVELEYWQVEKL